MSSKEQHGKRKDDQSVDESQPDSGAPAPEAEEEAPREGEFLDAEAVGSPAEDEASEDASGDVTTDAEGEDRVIQLEEALQDAEARAEEYWNQLVRARAELENQQRRAQKDVEQAKRQGLEKIATDLLQVKDSLEMGVQAANEPDADVAKLREGSELTLKMLGQVFERFGVEELNPEGERFNPEYHEAMATQPSAEHEPNTVLHVVQKGYALQERLLRPAMVIVAKKSEDTPPSSGGQIDEQA